MQSKVRNLISFFVIVFCVSLDQYTKCLAQANISSSGSDWIKGVVGFSYTENSGIAFSMFTNSSFVLLILIAICLVALLAYIVLSCYDKSFMFFLSLLLILSGGIGNWIDRLRFGYVIDFIEMRCFSFPIFNIADCVVSIGGFLMVVDVLRDLFVKKPTDI